MPTQADLALQALSSGAPVQPARQAPAMSQADIALNSIGQANDDPSAGGSTIQIYNPFGSNVDTGIPIGETANRFLAGAGKAFNDIGTGVRKVGAMVADVVSPQQQGLSDLVTGQVPQSRLDKIHQEVVEQRRLDAPLMANRAAKVGNFVGNAAIAAPTAFIPGANTYTGAALTGATLGLLQPTTSNTEDAMNVALGGAAGAGGKFLADKVAGLVRALRSGQGEALTPGQQAAVTTADNLGFQLTPGARTGNPQLLQIEAKLAGQPETSGAFTDIAANNQKALNRAAASAIGENSDNLSSEVLGNAANRLGSVFDSVADKTPVPLDPQVYGPRLKQVIQDSEGLLNNNASAADNGLMQRLDNFINTNGGATREQLRALSSNLGKAARNNMTSQGGDRELGIALSNAQNIVEDAIQSTLPADQAAAYTQARDQYRNLMNLTARNTIVNPSSGNVNGKALASALMSKDRGGFTFGNNDTDLYNAARFSQAFPSIVGDSGTATRMPFSVGQIPTRLAGALLTPSYMMGANKLAGQPVSNGWYGLMDRMANTDPLASELARLLMQPGAQKVAPQVAIESALQAKNALTNSP